MHKIVAGRFLVRSLASTLYKDRSVPLNRHRRIKSSTIVALRGHDDVRLQFTL